jgi:5'-3' exonuclease
MTEEIVLHKNKGLVLVDTGYYLFNRYFATLKWYRIVTKESVDIEGLHENEAFTTAFRAHILADVMKYCLFPYNEKKLTPKTKVSKKVKHVRNKLIFCLDCPRSRIWRMQKYAQYKATRKLSTDMNMNIVPLFHSYIDSLIASPPLTDMDIMKVGMDSLEADDIVYNTLKHIRKTVYESKVLVISNDNDFMQMIPMNVDVVNAKGEYLAERARYDADTMMMLKVLTGDTSDNIKPITCVGSNAATAMHLVEMSEKQRQEWIRAHGGAAGIKQYNLNKKLILLNKLPQNLGQAFALKYSITAI